MTQRGLDPRMATTALAVDGFFVTEQLGIVRGISVRSRSIVGTFAAGLQTIFGGDITILTRLCEGTRRDAFEIMIAHADRLGANAVIGVRYDATEIMRGVTEVLCYGTAVVIEANASDPRP
ncbi:MAG: YbjQ family protein [Gemmatimonadales bacterium]